MVTTQVQFARQDTNRPTKQRPAADEVARLLASINDLAPALAARAGEIEIARRIPADITNRLRRMGLIRTMLPRSHGGMELSVPEVLIVIETAPTSELSIIAISFGGRSYTGQSPREPSAQSPWGSPIAN